MGNTSNTAQQQQIDFVEEEHATLIKDLNKLYKDMETLAKQVKDFQEEYVGLMASEPFGVPVSMVSTHETIKGDLEQSVETLQNAASNVKSNRVTLEKYARDLRGVDTAGSSSVTK